MLDAIKDLLKSERGFAGGVLVIAASVLAGLGHMTIDQWIEYTQWIFVTYVAGKTVTGGVALIANKKAEPVPGGEPAPISTETK